MAEKKLFDFVNNQIYVRRLSRCTKNHAFIHCQLCKSILNPMQCSRHSEYIEVDAKARAKSSFLTTRSLLNRFQFCWSCCNFSHFCHKILLSNLLRGSANYIWLGNVSLCFNRLLSLTLSILIIQPVFAMTLII